MIKIIRHFDPLGPALAFAAFAFSLWSMRLWLVAFTAFSFGLSLGAAVMRASMKAAHD